jgi:hypothetical protein
LKTMRTWTHRETSDGRFRSSKLTTVLFSRLRAGAFTADFLKGSAPDALAHWWHRNPFPVEEAMVYFV